MHRRHVHCVHARAAQPWRNLPPLVVGPAYTAHPLLTPVGSPHLLHSSAVNRRGPSRRPQAGECCGIHCVPLRRPSKACEHPKCAHHLLRRCASIRAPGGTPQSPQEPVIRAVPHFILKISGAPWVPSRVALVTFTLHCSCRRGDLPVAASGQGQRMMQEVWRVSRCQFSGRTVRRIVRRHLRNERTALRAGGPGERNI